MKNYVQKGDTITLIAPGALSSGEGFVVGTIFAVALADAESGAEVEGRLVGVVSLPKATGTGSGWSQGAKIYWDPDTSKVTTTSDTNTIPIGAATAQAADGDATAVVRLNGVFGLT